MHWIARFFLLLCLTGTAYVHADKNADTEADYQEKLTELQSTINQLQKELNRVKSDRDSLQQNLQKSEVDISEVIKKIERLKQELASQKKQLAQLNNQRNELRKQRQTQQAAISEEVNAAYRLGRQSQLKLVLNQQQPDQVARMLKYYDYFIDARASRIDTYLEVIAELNQVEPAITAKTEALQQSQQSLEQRYADLNKSQTERQRTLQKLNASITNKDQQLKQKGEDRQRLQKLLEEVTQALSGLSRPDDGQPFAKLQGKLHWPAQGNILKTYGTPREGKLRWEGVMINAPVGRDVKAIHHGHVVFADYLRGHGLLVIVDHGKGYMSLYAHNQSLLKATGDWVSGGDVIAQVGNSGGQTQAGLYFEIRHQGKPVNPSLWCRS